MIYVLTEKSTDGVAKEVYTSKEGDEQKPGWPIPDTYAKSKEKIIICPFESLIRPWT
jgi:hypothetical protein